MSALAMSNVENKNITPVKKMLEKPSGGKSIKSPMRKPLVDLKDSINTPTKASPVKQSAKKSAKLEPKKTATKVEDDPETRGILIKAILDARDIKYRLATSNEEMKASIASVSEQCEQYSHSPEQRQQEEISAEVIEMKKQLSKLINHRKKQMESASESELVEVKKEPTDLKCEIATPLKQGNSGKGGSRPTPTSAKRRIGPHVKKARAQQRTTCTALEPGADLLGAEVQTQPISWTYTAVCMAAVAVGICLHLSLAQLRTSDVRI